MKSLEGLLKEYRNAKSIPTAAKLKILARKVVDIQCTPWMEADYTPINPMKLTLKDVEKINIWQAQQVGLSDVQKWNSAVFYELEDDSSFYLVGEESIPLLHRYLLHLESQAKIFVDSANAAVENSSESERKDALTTLKKAKETWDEATKDRTSMEGTSFGSYKFEKPTSKTTMQCSPNLFNSRVFLNQLHHRDVNQVRVMHWNILADGLAGSSLAFNGLSKSLIKQFKSSKESLMWSYRQWLILEEIAHYEPDIITLVELDSNQDYYGKDTFKKYDDCLNKI